MLVLEQAQRQQVAAARILLANVCLLFMQVQHNQIAGMQGATRGSASASS